MIRIGVLKDSFHWGITVATPTSIVPFNTEEYSFLIEAGAGLAAGITDDDYRKVGAQIVENREELIEKSTILISYQELPTKASLRGKTLIGSYNLLNNLELKTEFSSYESAVFSLDLLPRNSLAQAMDVLSSTASIAGYQAVLTAASIAPFTFPMLTGAGGTLKPAHVLIIGSGVAGLQAIATAKRLGAVVRAFDVRSASKTEVESLGAKFIEIEGARENKQAGGYAVEQENNYLERLDSVLHEECLLADVIISTAKIPGKRAPLLIKEETVNQMKKGAVIIDLAADAGGNCAVTVADQSIVHKGITVIGHTKLISQCAKAISFLLANNYASFLKHYFKNQQTLTSDPLLSASQVASFQLVS